MRIEGLINLNDADLAPWRNLNENFNVLVLVIDPCPDVYTNVPILNRIADDHALHGDDRAVLYSSTEFKKIRLHYFTEDYRRWEEEHS